jgi:ferredoxin
VTRILVDTDVCFGSGECVLAAPEVFEMDPGGTARVRTDASPIDPASAQRVVDGCPSGALRLATPDDGVRRR